MNHPEARVRAYGCKRGLTLNNWLIIQLVIGIVLLATTFGSQSVQMINQVEVSNINVIQAVMEKSETEGDTEVPRKTKTTREAVVEYYSDIPILIDVAYCESRFSQFNTDGSVTRGVVNPADVGVMQINEKYHLETSIKLGLDIHTLEGNLAYGKFLYETQGTRPWEYSSHCWNKTREVALR